MRAYPSTRKRRGDDGGVTMVWGSGTGVERRCGALCFDRLPVLFKGLPRNSGRLPFNSLGRHGMFTASSGASRPDVVRYVAPGVENSTACRCRQAACRLNLCGAAVGSDANDVRRVKPFLSGPDLEFDFLALGEGLEAFHLDRGEVHEH